jgi:hypothetical protein
MLIIFFILFHIKSLLQEKITQLESASAEQEKENSEKLETLHELSFLVRVTLYEIK